LFHRQFLSHNSWTYSLASAVMESYSLRNKFARYQISWYVISNPATDCFCMLLPLIPGAHIWFVSVTQCRNCLRLIVYIRMGLAANGLSGKDSTIQGGSCSQKGKHLWQFWTLFTSNFQILSLYLCQP
jgi:hypothetical protein